MKYNKTNAKGYDRYKMDYLQKSFSYVHPYTNKKEFIPKGAIFKDVKTIYKGDEIRVIHKLTEKYGGEVCQWQKRVGKIESDIYIFDMHWYERDGKQYDMKLKNRKDKI